MKVTINEKTVTLKYNFYMFYLYENLYNKSFDANNLNYDSLINIFYCAIAARFYREGYDSLSFTDFMNWFDDKEDSEQILVEFITWLMNNAVNQAKMIEKSDTKEIDDKKKKSKKSEKN